MQIRIRDEGGRSKSITTPIYVIDKTSLVIDKFISVNAKTKNNTFLNDDIDFTNIKIV